MAETLDETSTSGFGYDTAKVGGKQLFISYSRRNETFVTRLRADLQAAGLNIWIDRVGLKPGTQDWDEALRSAIASAEGVLLIATPDSRRSLYVGDEIAIARMHRKPIYPVWADGNDWIDAIPMGMGRTQNVDMRGSGYAAGLARLIAIFVGAQQADVQLPTADDAEASHDELVLSDDFIPFNPYKGLRPFTSEDRGLFFGRTAFVLDLLNALRDDARFLAVIGASGSGKSSVMMAGLLPRLYEGGLPDSASWLYLDPFRFGSTPIENLAITLVAKMRASGHSATTNDILRELQDVTRRGLLRIVKSLVTGDQRVVLYIDQFEELFTVVSSESERRTVIDLITTAASEQDSPLTVLLTMRADYFDRPLAYSELGRLIEARSKTILPLSLEELREIVERPAERPSSRLVFDEGLVPELVFSVRDQVGGLPLLQFTLDQLFERREGRRLTWKAYQAMGGLKGALAKHAEATFQSLPSDEHKRLARSLFLRLIQVGAVEHVATRRRATLRELDMPSVAQNETMRQVLDTFASTARLLIVDESGQQPVVEVAHEALIREWSRLSDWVREARDDIRLQGALSDDAQEWKRRDQPTDMLYRGKVLEDAQGWLVRNQPTKLEQEFVEQSARQSLRLRGQRRVLVALFIVLALAIPLMWLSLSAEQSRRDNENLSTQVALTERQNAEARSMALAAAARDAFQRDQIQALAFAVAANSIPDPPLFAQRILAEVAYAAGPRFRLSGVGRVHDDFVLSPDAQMLVSIPSGGNEVSLWDARSGELVRTLGGFNDRVWSAAFSPDGRMALILPSRDLLTLWDLESGDARKLDAEGFAYGDIVLNPSQQTLIVPTGLVIAVNIETWTVSYMSPWDVGAYDAAVSPDGRQILTGWYSDGSALGVWEDGAEPTTQIFGRDFPWGFMDDLGYLDRWVGLSGACWSNEIRAQDPNCVRREITVWDLETQQPIEVLRGHEGDIWDADFSDDGTMIISAGGMVNSGELILWDTRTGGILRRFASEQQVIQSAGFNYDGTHVFSYSPDGSVIVWDIRDRMQLATGELPATSRPRSPVSRTDTFTELSVPSRTGDVLLVSRCAEVGVLNHCQRSEVNLVDAATGTVDRVLAGHSNAVLSAAFSPDGRSVLTGSCATLSIDLNVNIVCSQGEVILWDVATGEILRRFTGHADWVTVVAFAPDGHSATSTDPSGYTIAWRIDNLEELLEWTRQNRYVRELTCAEKRQYDVEPLCGADFLSLTSTPAPPPTETPN